MDIRKFFKHDEIPKKKARLDTISSNPSETVTTPMTSLSSESPLASMSSMKAPDDDNSTTCKSRDIGVYLGKMSSVDDLTKFRLLTDPWVPEKDYNFPASRHVKRGREEKRRVNLGHLDKYRWLVFSHEKKGLFCKYCSIFANQKLVGGKKTVPLQKLVTEPLQKFAKLTGKNGDLESHAAHTYHKEAVIDGDSFVHIFKNPNKDVKNMLDEKRKLQVEENRARLAPIIKTVLLHGRQNIPLRGHRDDGNMVDLSEDPVQNDGNFRSLLRFRVESGDVQLKNHLNSAKANATYISKTTTNEIIKYCGDEIIDEIRKRVDVAKYYSVLFDETTDISHTSQLSISLRYLHNEAGTGATVREDFVGFLDLHEKNYSTTNSTFCEPVISGEILGQTVVKFMEEHGLNLENCVGIGSDGCSVNVSDVRGAAAEIKKKAVNSTLCICKNHSLNLALSKSSKVQAVRNTLGTMKEVSTFFSMSAKRNHVLRNILGHKVKNYCETRWVERHEAILEFKEDLLKIAEALQIISNWQDSSTSSKSLCLLNSIANCEFITTVHCLSDVLSSTVILSKYLQEENTDISHAHQKVKQAIDTLKDKRLKCDRVFPLVFECAKKSMEEIGVEEHLPRLVGKQINRPNYAASSTDPSDYWKQSIYIPILDHVIMDLETRFQTESMNSFYLFALVPVNLDKLSDIKTLKDAIDHICDQYAPLLNQDGMTLKHRLLNEILSIKKDAIYKEYKKISRSVNAYANCDKNAYPLMNSLLKLLSTLPISVATAERSFSTLRRLKTWIRSRMGEDRLTGLALLHVHRDIDVAVNNVIDRFASSKNRRVQFIL